MLIDDTHFESILVQKSQTSFIIEFSLKKMLRFYCADSRDFRGNIEGFQEKSFEFSKEFSIETQFIKRFKGFPTNSSVELKVTSRKLFKRDFREISYFLRIYNFVF